MSPAERRLLCYTLQVVVSHCMAAALAEMVFTRDGFEFPAIVGFVEFTTFSLAPLLRWALLYGPRAAAGHAAASLLSPGELLHFSLCGVTMVLSHGIGLAAYLRINYTTAMLFSSAKPPTVMLMGALVNRGSQTTCDSYLAAMGVTLGLCLFGLAEKRDAPRFSTLGLLLVALNLGLGAVSFNLQQRVLHRLGGRAPAPRAAQRPRWQLSPRSAAEGPPNPERMMVVMYAAGALLFLACAAASGELALFPAWSRGRGSSVARDLAPIFCGAFLTAIGISALLRVTAEFDATRASVITSSRKVFTFAMSFVLFPKVFSVLHFLGATLTLSGSFAVHRSLKHRDGARAHCAKPGEDSSAV